MSPSSRFLQSRCRRSARANGPCSPSISRKPITTAAGSASAREPATRAIFTSRPATAETPTTRDRATSNRAATRKTPPRCSAKCCAFTRTTRPAGSYSIPADNPFVGSATDKQEIWAFGLRNPFRNSFDRLLGTFFIGDVGQDSREEIDAQAATEPGGGENYGWRVREGFIQNPAYPHDPVPPDAVDPAYDYPHSVGQTVIGGYIYRGKKIKALRGLYVFADYLGPDRATSPGVFSPSASTARSRRISRTSRRLFPTRVGQFSAAQSGVVRRRRQRRALHRRHLEREHFPDPRRLYVG